MRQTTQGGEAPEMEEIIQLFGKMNLEAKARTADYIGDLGETSLSADMRQIQACARAAARDIEAGSIEAGAALLLLIGDKIDLICQRLAERKSHAARA